MGVYSEYDTRIDKPYNKAEGKLGEHCIFYLDRREDKAEAEAWELCIDVWSGKDYSGGGQTERSWEYFPSRKEAEAKIKEVEQLHKEALSCQVFYSRGLEAWERRREYGQEEAGEALG